MEHRLGMLDPIEAKQSAGFSGSDIGRCSADSADSPSVGDRANP
jgi:hypothetical protein